MIEVWSRRRHSVVVRGGRGGGLSYKVVGPARWKQVAIFARDIGEGGGLILEWLRMLVFLGLKPLLVGHHLEDVVILKSWVIGSWMEDAEERG